MQTKTNSNIATHTAMGVFKGFLSGANRTSTEKYLQREVDFLIDIFTENGYDRNTLTNIAT